MTQMYKKTDSKPPMKTQKDWEDEVCQLVGEEWEKGQTYVSDLNTMYEDLYALFRGKRPDKHYDWQSDISLRKAFQVCWTTITYAMKKIFGGSPIMGVEGFDQKGCWQREIMLEKWGNADASFLFHVMAWLRLTLNGVVFIKKTWKQKIVPGQIPIPEIDQPHNQVLDNKDVVVDWRLSPGQPCREGRFVIHQEVIDFGSLYGMKNIKNLDKLDPEALTGTKHDENHSKEQSINNQNDTPVSPIYKDIVIRERQGTFAVVQKNGEWIPELDPDKIYKEGSKVQLMEMVAWVADPGSQNVLIRWEPNPYGEKTIIDGHLYFDPVRWHSVGSLEPSRDIFGAIDDNVNAMFDEIWKNLMPPTVFNKFAMVEWDTIQHAPNQKWMVGGDPNAAVMFTRPSNITGDAWQKHVMLDSEQQLTSSVTNNMQGAGKEKTATQGVLNTQFSTDKLDFLLSMYERTVMKPDAQMTLRFAQKFANPLTFIAMLGEPFKFDTGFNEEYKFNPTASSVKLEQQKEMETQQDIQLIQIAASIQNPGAAKVINQLFANILRNRNNPKMAAQFDEDYYEPSSPAGNVQMMNRMSGPSNQNQIEMSQPEKSVRNSTFKPRGLLN